MKRLRVLAMDPGTASFAVSVVTIELEPKLRFKVEGSSMLDPQRLVSDMKDLRNQLQTFVEYLTPLLSEHFDIFIIERFQARGNKGPTIECVSSMLSALCLTFPHIPIVNCVTAGVWKNAYNLFGDLKETYEDHKQHSKDKSMPHIKIHQLDACLMAFYAAAKAQDLKPFDFLTDTERERKFMEKLDRAPSLPQIPPPLPKKPKAKRTKRK